MRGGNQATGGVLEHAVNRIKGQYLSPEDRKKCDRGTIRQVLRAEKNKSGVKNGRFMLSEDALKKLKIQSKEDLFVVVVNGVATTVMDKREFELLR